MKKLIFLGLLVGTAMNAATKKTDTRYLFSHGIADSHKQAFKYVESENSQKPYILKHPLITFDYPDVSNSIFKMNRTQTSLAQENEVNRLAHAFFSTMAETPQSVLVGVSRGASTLINFMGIHNPANVAALILESPFDCVESIINCLIHETKLSWIPGIKRNGLSLMSFVFCKYRADGIRPIDYAASIKTDLPILIVCSAQDKLIPAWSSINLYITLRNSGHTNTYLLVLPEGQHAKLINNHTYGPLYQQITHAFYQKFDLPHDAHYAQLGLPLLNICQPDPSSLKLFYPSYVTSLKNTPQKPTINKKT
jgi:alpha-beta hydrolase superfamily lysophospholipase